MLTRTSDFLETLNDGTGYTHKETRKSAMKVSYERIDEVMRVLAVYSVLYSCYTHSQMLLLLLSWCLMSSDVIWHIRDKLWPMPKHGSIRKVCACLAVTCHLHFWQNDRDFLRATVVTRGWNGYRNKSQHRKSTLEKKILPPFQQGFEPATFQSQVRRSNHWAIPAPIHIHRSCTTCFMWLVCALCDWCVFKGDN